MHSLRHLRTLGAWCSVVLIFVAGVAKVLYPAEFFGALNSWQSIPKHALPYLVSTVPLAEIVISTAWILNLARRPFHLLAVALIALFSSAYLHHLALHGVPRCGCTGVSTRWMDSPAIVLARNALLLVAIGFSLPARASPSPKSSSPSP
ncbi:MAG: MauE/DoxX family redox-associated membrane protein [Phycisphaerales bacterium]